MMKRVRNVLIWSLTLTVGAAALTGCSGGEGGKTSAAQVLGGSFTADMTLSMEDSDAVGTIARYGEGQWRAEFSEPSSLAGIVLDFSGSEVTTSYQGLAFSIPQSAMPAKSVLTGLIQVVDTLAQEEQITGEAQEDQIAVSGEWEGNPYVLTLDKTGALVGFEMEGYDAAITFVQFESGAVATSTTQLETSE